MKPLKPVIRVRLVPNTRSNSAFDVIIGGQRMDGVDHWEVKVTIITTENHVTQHKFISCSKQTALGKAYAWLRKNSVEVWFDAWVKMMYSQFDLMFDEPYQLDRFASDIERVRLGNVEAEAVEISWKNKLKYFTDKREEPVKEDTHVTVKWSFWNWFK